MKIPSGITDQFVYFVAVDATDFTSRETGLSSFTVTRSRNGATAATMTTPTVNETSVSLLPGVYELLLDEDMTIGAGNESEEMCFHITHTGMAPVTRTIELYLSIPDQVWDEVLTGGHNDMDSASQFLKNTQLRGDDAQAGDATHITLATAAVATDDIYNGAVIALTGGTGEGQVRTIIDYVGSTKVAEVDRAWTVNPASGTRYSIKATADPGAVLALLPSALVSGRMDSNMSAINDVNAAAVRLALSAGQMIPGTVDNTAFTATTTILESDDITEDTADNFNGRNILWTSGIMIASMTDITDYALTGGRGRFTVSTMPETPGDDDTFIVI